jgi:AcrR family transcriptional regulator
MPKVLPEYRAQARTRIVAAAREVFVKKGLGNSSMEDIARAIGVSKGALYLYFPNRLALIKAVQELARNEFRSDFDAMLEVEDIAESFAQFVEEKIPQHSEADVWHTLMVEASHDPGFRQVMYEDQVEDLKVLEQFLRDAQKKGRLKGLRDPHTTAFALMLLFQGVAFGSAVGRQTTSDRRTFVKAIKLLLGE